MDKEYGLILDIDDTLADTFSHFVHKINTRWGNAKNLTDKEIVQKYHIMPAIPFWQTAEILEWLEEQAFSNSAQEKIETIDGAVVAVEKIQKIIPVVGYVTSRLENVREGTVKWLKKNQFPDAPLYMRDGEFDNENGNAWKADVMKEYFSADSVIIDDNSEVIQFLDPSFIGTFVLFGENADNFQKTQQQKFILENCKDWKGVMSRVAVLVEKKP